MEEGKEEKKDRNQGNEERERDVREGRNERVRGTRKEKSVHETTRGREIERDEGETYGDFHRRLTLTLFF